MRSTRVLLFAAFVLSCTMSAVAQISAVERAGFGLPPGQVAAPNSPGGAAVIGKNVYTGDGAQGFRHWIPTDPANPDPINNGILVFDTALGYSLGGGGLCLPFCQVGQIAFDGNQTIYVAAYDHPKHNGATLPGIWRLSIDPVAGRLQGAILLVPNAGLAGNGTTSIAFGPDGNLYVGFLKNGNVVRIVNPMLNPPDPRQIVQSVGTAPNGRPIRALAFVGNDLYLAHTAGLAVIKNAIAPSCQGGCNGIAISDGFNGVAHVGLTTDGVNRLYLSIDNQVWRYTISSKAMNLISTGGNDANSGAPLSFAFVAGHTNLLQLDRLGNLWVGDDTSDGKLNFSGRLWYISAGALSNVP